MKAEAGLEAAETMGSLVQGLRIALVEKAEDTIDPEKRWKKTFNTYMSFLAKSVVGLTRSEIKTDELSLFQKVINTIFRRTDYVLEIRNNIDQQNIFLLGYCHAMNQVIINFEESTAYKKDDSVNTIISSYTHVAPVLLALDERTELSHQELSEYTGISKSALSNFMAKMHEYRLFDSRRTGRHCYYSISHPNGESALKAVKDRGQPSRESYTDFLSQLLISLYEVGQNDEYDERYVLDKYSAMLPKYTSKPALCKKQIKDLAMLLNSER